jgi:fructokinase
MRAWGMDRSGVQVDQTVSTGEVRVDLDGGAPTFAILPDRAYDRLKCDAAVAALHGQGIALVYHGTLIARSEPARTAVLAVRERCRAPIFVDVNLRDPWWSAPVVASLLRGARWVKLNDEELARLTGARSDALPGGLESSVAEFARRHGFAQVVVTLGDQGALVWSEQRPITDRPPHAVEVIDTVGAGDAFSAVWIAGLMGGWTAQTALSRALEFAAELCAVRGAISESRVLYDRHLKRWGDR